LEEVERQLSLDYNPEGDKNDVQFKPFKAKGGVSLLPEGGFKADDLQLQVGWQKDLIPPALTHTHWGNLILGLEVGVNGPGASVSGGLTDKSFGASLKARLASFDAAVIVFGQKGKVEVGAMLGAGWEFKKGVTGKLPLAEASVELDRKKGIRAVGGIIGMLGGLTSPNALMQRAAEVAGSTNLVNPTMIGIHDHANGVSCFQMDASCGRPPVVLHQSFDPSGGTDGPMSLPREMTERP
jgi:hypothetical protein